MAYHNEQDKNKTDVQRTKPTLGPAMPIPLPSLTMLNPTPWFGSISLSPCSFLLWRVPAVCNRLKEAKDVQGVVNNTTNNAGEDSVRAT